jgi:hypothetical protein
MDHGMDIRALVRSAAASAGDASGLATLTQRCWPTASDTTQPAARAWVRFWGPKLIAAPAPDCACATGACGWCN